MHAGPGGVVPGDDERRVDVLYDERHDDQLSGGDAVPCGDVHVLCWAGILLELPFSQHVSVAVHELLLQHGLLRERFTAL